jgi:hypothetical protein
MKQDIDLRIIELGLILPPAPKPVGVYKPVLVVDKFLYISGQGPIQGDGTMMKGKVGADLDTVAGKIAARQVGLTMLSFWGAEKNQTYSKSSGYGKLHSRFR